MSAVMAADASTGIPAGDEGVRRLEAHRSELRSHCRTIVGPAEADDAVQETLVRAWRALDRFEARASLRTWLYRIATNVCLDMLDTRRRRPRIPSWRPRT